MSSSNLVLVVDDDLGMLQGLNRLLKVHGFKAELFDSIEKIEARGNLDDALCLVLDIDLNGRSGIELHRKLRGRGVSLPVIFITGNDNEVVRKEAIASGCVAYLTKPFLAKALIGPIEKIASVPSYEPGMDRRADRASH